MFVWVVLGYLIWVCGWVVWGYLGRRGLDILVLLLFSSLLFWPS
jgi:hypothetical protein